MRGEGWDRREGARRLSVNVWQEEDEMMSMSWVGDTHTTTYSPD